MEQQMSNNAASQTSEDEKTGLPWPRTWPGVYALVVGVFLAWIVLLTTLTMMFS
jgi:hypothetical protein